MPTNDNHDFLRSGRLFTGVHDKQRPTRVSPRPVHVLLALRNPSNLESAARVAHDVDVHTCTVCQISMPCVPSEALGMYCRSVRPASTTLRRPAPAAETRMTQFRHVLEGLWGVGVCQCALLRSRALALKSWTLKSGYPSHGSAIGSGNDPGTSTACGTCMCRSVRGPV